LVPEVPDHFPEVLWDSVVKRGPGGRLWHIQLQGQQQQEEETAESHDDYLALPTAENGRIDEEAKDYMAQVGHNSLSTSISSFTWKMFSSLLENRQTSKGNMLVCPLAAHLALAPVQLGAGRKTRKELDEVLGKWTKAKFTYRHLLKLLLEENINIVSRLYLAKGLIPKPKYKKKLKNILKADVETKDFKKNNDKTRREINRWVSKATKGKIRNFIPKNELKKDIALVSIAALHFHGHWVHPFAKKKTKRRPFHRNSTDTVLVQMMHHAKPIKTLYIKSDQLGARVVRLPYKNERDNDSMSMYLLLPVEKHQLDTTVEKIGKFGLDQLFSDFDRYKDLGNMTKEVKVDLPRFVSDKRLRLDAPLRSMGLKEMFTPSATLSGMVDPATAIDSDYNKLRVSEIFEKIHLTVDEKGSQVSVAAAVKVSFWKSGSLEPSERFTCNQPFLFIIRDDRTKVPLLTGRIKDPLKRK